MSALGCGGSGVQQTTKLLLPQPPAAAPFTCQTQVEPPALGATKGTSAARLGGAALGESGRDAPDEREDGERLLCGGGGGGDSDGDSGEAAERGSSEAAALLTHKSVCATGTPWGGGVQGAGVTFPPELVSIPEPRQSSCE